MTDQTSQSGSAHGSTTSTADELKAKGAEAAEMAREKAGEFAAEARSRATAYGEDAKNTAADEASKVAQALRKASGDLRDGSPQERIVGRLADGIADAAEGLKRMDVEQIGREITDFARRNPLAFLGGAALLGFAAARFLKASSRPSSGAYASRGRLPHQSQPGGYRSAPGQTGSGYSGTSSTGSASRPGGAVGGTGSTGATPGGALSGTGASGQTPSSQGVSSGSTLGAGGTGSTGSKTSGSTGASGSSSTGSGSTGGGSSGSSTGGASGTSGYKPAGSSPDDKGGNL